MSPFSFTRAQDADEAVSELGGHSSTRLIAGGTNLLDLMKEAVARPTRLVDINNLPLAKLEELSHGGVLLGALMTNADTAYHDTIRSRYPLVSKAILAGASPQLRNMATNGGNLLQRTRCYYFYDAGTPCNKREPGSGCPAIKGLNRIHAILGTSDQCIAVHPSDFCVALAALEARIHVHGPDRDRVIPMEGFHRLPEDQPNIDTNLRKDELITGIELPKQGFAEHYSYIKVRDRESYAFALVSVAVGLEMEGSVIKDARIALGGVAHKPWRIPEAEESLKGRPADLASCQRAAEILLEGARGYGLNTFKIELARRVIIRGLQEASGHRRGQP